ncbi:hypothetical protein [Providencia stuartii]|uniref:Uncharacterized protein n=1 Tax=Providencia stuartii ATCC 25827 TaxID=471874 RepID=A0AA86Z4F1_PROST|nr:hypothetical protein PROSTU_00090 [Providencia stuartii ATCC 25827]
MAFIHAVELLHLRDVGLSARHFKPDTALLQRMTERAFIQAFTPLSIHQGDIASPSNLTIKETR